MILTAADIAEIAKLLDQSKFASLDLEMGEFRLRIRRDGGEGTPPEREEAQVAIDAAPDPVDLQVGPGAGEVDVPAPLLGNFYAAPRPGDPPFVALGDAVGEDTTIGIIEVMKLMNPIRAGISGTVSAILAEDGKAVAEGQALIRVKVA